MITACLDTASLARVRFAPSPAYEAAAWLAWTVVGGRHPVFGDPGPAARFALRDRSVAVTAQLVRGTLTPGLVPDFLTPKPDLLASRTSLGISPQLERIRATPGEVVREQLRGVGRPAWSLPADRLPQVVATGLSRFWRLAMAEPWSRVSRLLYEEQDRRMGVAAAAGIGTMLSTLHPAVGWTGSALVVDMVYEKQISYVDAELVLVPSLLAGPRLSVQLCDPADASLAFPAAVPRREATTSSGALLGRGRARVLRAAGRPVTTTRLSEQLGLAPATVSRHLQVLLGAGLVRRTRQGRHVVYVQTADAQRLLAPLD